MIWHVVDISLNVALGIAVVILCLILAVLSADLIFQWMEMTP